MITIERAFSFYYFLANGGLKLDPHALHVLYVLQPRSFIALYSSTQATKKYIKKALITVYSV